MNTMQAKKQRHPARLGQTSLRSYLRQHSILYLMLIPGLVIFLLFCYKPMGGILMAFENYSYKKGLFGSPWRKRFPQPKGSCSGMRQRGRCIRCKPPLENLSACCENVYFAARKYSLRSC